MYVLVNYDVASSDCGGKRRLNRVAKICTKYGQRVQLSVFECLVSYGQYLTLKHDLAKAIDPNKDSLRFYNLGKHCQKRVEVLGRQDSYDPEAPLVI
jgi:CRISPR-associated protein Cas2